MDFILNFFKNKTSISFNKEDREKEAALLEELKKRGIKWDDGSPIDVSKSLIPCTYLWGNEGGLLYVK